jgi:hypothetical protein
MADIPNLPSVGDNQSSLISAFKGLDINKAQDSVDQSSNEQTAKK